MPEKVAGQDKSDKPERKPERKPDKLAEARATGKAIRDALAANMQARIGDVVEGVVLSETRDVLVSVLQQYLEQIIPDVHVAGLIHLGPSVEKPEKVAFELSVNGKLILSIEPGAEDDTLPDPVPGPEYLAEPPKT